MCSGVLWDWLHCFCFYNSWVLKKKMLLVVGEVPLISSAIYQSEGGKNSFFRHNFTLLLPLDGIPVIARDICEG